MATAILSVGPAWTQVKAGAADVNLQNVSSDAIYYAVMGSPPAASAIGALLRGGVTHPVRAGEVEYIYARLADVSRPSATGTVAVTDA